MAILWDILWETILIRRHYDNKKTQEFLSDFEKSDYGSMLLLYTFDVKGLQCNVYVEGNFCDHSKGMT